MNKFKLKLRDNINGVIEIHDRKSCGLILKIKSIYKNIKFNANINFKINIINKKAKITNLKILYLDIDDYMSCSYFDKIYRINIDNSSSDENNSSKIYYELKSFIKNITLKTYNNNIHSIIFNLNNNNISKMNIKGKII